MAPGSKWAAKNSLDIAVATRWRFARGSAARITEGSMKLWWLAAKTTGPSAADTYSSPSARIQAKRRVMGRSHTASAARRRRRTGQA